MTTRDLNLIDGYVFKDVSSDNETDCDTDALACGDEDSIKNLQVVDGPKINAAGDSAILENEESFEELAEENVDDQEEFQNSDASTDEETARPLPKVTEAIIEEAEKHTFKSLTKEYEPFTIGLAFLATLHYALMVGGTAIFLYFKFFTGKWNFADYICCSIGVKAVLVETTVYILMWNAIIKRHGHTFEQIRRKRIDSYVKKRM
uniref:DUF3021 family protein n=1 Tax=Panagrellus redivivus TaxID=6233 RepID=A0A7E4V9T8_PANRE